MARKQRELPKGLSRRGNVIWMSYNLNGKQVRESCHTDNEATALRLLEQKRTAIFEGRHVPTKPQDPITLGELKDLWLKHASAKATIAKDKQRFEKVLEILGADTFIHDIDHEDIEDLKKTLLESDTFRGTKMTPATVNRYLALIRSAFNYATKGRYPHKNPMAAVRFFEEIPRERVCSSDEYSRLIDGAKPQLRLAIVMAYWCGFRESEIAHLERSQIDLEAGFVSLSAKDTKTKKKRRVPLSSEATEELKRYLTAQAVTKLHGRIMTMEGEHISKAFGVRCKDLSIEDLKFHDLRHTALTRLHKSGTDIITLQAISGHKTIVTLKRYVHPDDETLRSAMDKSDKKIGKKQ